MQKYEQSKKFFDNYIDDYAREIMAIQPMFYKNAAIFLNKALTGSNTVLDVGNGGILNYNWQSIARLDCADLSVSQSAIQRYEKFSNISLFQSDILGLNNIEDNTYDAVIVQAVLHHLAGETINKTNKNVITALESCMRVLKPDGKLLIVESTVLPFFEQMERICYPLMQLFFKICNFGAVFQYSTPSLIKLIQYLDYNIVYSRAIALDKYTWIMKKKIPTIILPCLAVGIEISKG